MSTIAHYQRLFTYDAWANREVLSGLEIANPSPQRALKLLAHILSAERLWLERLLGETQTYPVWPEFTLAQCRLEAEELVRRWKNYIAELGESGLRGTVTYKNTKGEAWTNQREDILMHVAMHSAYHRGQIASEMRAAGIQPAYTDFIHGVRQGMVQ